MSAFHYVIRVVQHISIPCQSVLMCFMISGYWTLDWHHDTSTLMSWFALMELLCTKSPKMYTFLNANTSIDILFSANEGVYPEVYLEEKYIYIFLSFMYICILRFISSCSYFLLGIFGGQFLGFCHLSCCSSIVDIC